ncbi:MAG: methyltransferase, partial [Bacteroidota bacterium]
MYTEITKCRISQSTNLITVLSLGEQYLTGVFPKRIDENVTKGPLDLVWCPDSGLLQMKQSYSLEEMYGDNYGYRSGLNASMVRHLEHKIKTLERMVKLTDSDLVIDIGSNDATSLKAYSGKHRKVGIDPTGMKFKEFYTDTITLIPDFFSEKTFHTNFPGKKA